MSIASRAQGPHRIAFRVDASTLIGTGHVMRCLTLARALQARGASVLFVARHLLAHLQQMLADQGVPLAMLDGGSVEQGQDRGQHPGALAHAHWLGVSQQSDAQSTQEVLAGPRWDWLVVDHYGLDATWERVMRPHVENILVIDDLADRQHDCDALLDQNFYLDAQTRYLGKVPPACHLMLGPRYALLREEFRVARKHVAVRSGRVGRILLFFGGVDATNLTGRVMDALARGGVAGAEVDVVIGAQHPWREHIASDCARLGYRCHVQVAHMADLMAGADLSIGAGGTAIWERLCLGLPTLAFGTAQNQSRMLHDLAQAACLWGVEDARQIDDGQLAALVSCARMGGPVWQGFSARGMDLVDGQGVHRVLRHLTAPVFDFRRATPDDTKLLFAWRNHPAIRAASLETGPLDPDAHNAWLTRTLADGSRHLLVAEVQGLPMAVVRFDLQGQDARISVYLSPSHLHQGLGAGLLRQASTWLRRAGLPARRVVAQVQAHNPASLQSFRRAGYRDETHTLVLDLEQT